MQIVTSGFRFWLIGMWSFRVGVLYSRGIDVDTLSQDQDVCWVFERIRDCGFGDAGDAGVVGS